MRREGATRAEVAAHLGISAGSVSAAWRGERVEPVTPPPAPPAVPRDPVEPAEPAAPITRTELRAVLAGVVRDLQAEIDAANAAGDTARAATTRRMLATIVPALARVTPAEPSDDASKIVIDAAELDGAAQLVRALLHDRLAKALAKAGSP
jgi:hypothetical protein